MSTLARYAVFVAALLSLFAVGSSTAGAVTWHNSGDTAYTATTGAITLSSTSTGLVCPSGTQTATVSATPAVGATWTAMSGTDVWTGCTLGVSGYSLACKWTKTATSSPSFGVTTGTNHGTCSTYLVGQGICHETITSHFTITNAPAAPPDNTRVAHTTGGTITVKNGPSASCPLGNNESAHLSAHTFVVTSATGGASSPHQGPIITRTA